MAVKQRTGGRNGNMGRMTMRHHGGGHKQKLRLIDFKRDKFGVPGKVATIEKYDPNRSSRIALISYADGEKRLHHSAGRPHRRPDDPCPARTPTFWLAMLFR